MNYSVVVSKSDKTLQKVRTHSLRRFLKILRTINWKNSPSVYLRVSYGKQKDYAGKLINFYNDGVYDNKSDLWQAFNAFTEK